MAAGLAEREPAWLRSLLGARFFEACAAHRGMSRNECNQYCLTCAAAADDAGGATALGCQWCLVAGAGGGPRGRIAVTVTGWSRVVFLNERPQAPRNGRCAAAAAVACAACEACGRGLLDVAFRFCSLGCKLKCMESDPTLTFTIDPNNIPEPQISGPQEDEEEDDDEEDEPFYPTKANAAQSKAARACGCRPPLRPSASSSRPRRGGRRVARGDKEEDQEARRQHPRLRRRRGAVGAGRLRRRPQQLPAAR
ncbi:hypothetical protein OsJ_05723 [Oryza sativa Japonica Group]|uniref:Uncharacterized protein n=1 Tax=Oryza sativa subsp. japonica TaxID=39947 RepID=A3A425_ORYSJ|nr:hypothetical protein OsJ_05723 [Oryza sativa Japonica Group]